MVPSGHFVPEVLSLSKTKSENESELFGASTDGYNQTDVLPQDKRLDRKSAVAQQRVDKTHGASGGESVKNRLSLVLPFLSHRSSRSQDLASKMVNIPS